MKIVLRASALQCVVPGCGRRWLIPNV